jgi:hypothetical protein
MKRFWLIVLALAFLPACTKPVWIHPEKTPSQYGPDRWECEQDLAQRCQSSVNVYANKPGILGLIRSGKQKCEVDENDVDRCMALKPGWVKQEVPK